jgi:hypothetical protein
VNTLWRERNFNCLSLVYKFIIIDEQSVILCKSSSEQFDIETDTQICKVQKIQTTSAVQNLWNLDYAMLHTNYHLPTCIGAAVLVTVTKQIWLRKRNHHHPEHTSVIANFLNCSDTTQYRSIWVVMWWSSALSIEIRTVRVRTHIESKQKTSMIEEQSQ